MEEYTLTVAGIEHTVQMTADEAKSRGLERKEASRPANKAARKPVNKASGDRSDDHT